MTLVGVLVGRPFFFSPENCGRRDAELWVNAIMAFINEIFWGGFFYLSSNELTFLLLSHDPEAY
jgi:hypothetical protein